MADDGSGVLLEYMTAISVAISDQSHLSSEMTRELLQWGQDFEHRLDNALPRDPNSVDAIEFMALWTKLHGDFKAFMETVPFADQLGLADMLRMTADFEDDYRLPRIKHRVHKKPPKAPEVKEQQPKQPPSISGEPFPPIPPGL